MAPTWLLSSLLSIGARQSVHETRHAYGKSAFGGPPACSRRIVQGKRFPLPKKKGARRPQDLRTTQVHSSPSTFHCRQNSLADSTTFNTLASSWTVSQLRRESRNFKVQVLDDLAFQTLRHISESCLAEHPLRGLGCVPNPLVHLLVALWQNCRQLARHHF